MERLSFFTFIILVLISCNSEISVDILSSKSITPQNTPVPTVIGTLSLDTNAALTVSEGAVMVG